MCLKNTPEAAAICSSHLRNPQGGESCPIRLSSSSARVYSQEGRYAVRTGRIKTRRKETSPISPTGIDKGLQGSLAITVAIFAMKYRCTVYCCISFGRLDEVRDYVLGLQLQRTYLLGYQRISFCSASHLRLKVPIVSTSPVHRGPSSKREEKRVESFLSNPP